VQCTGVVLDLRMRLVLYWEGGYAAETGYVNKGDVAAADQNVDTACISGWYQGWAYMDLTPPPGYVGRKKLSEWSIRRYVKCPI
jgi:hypothetical protein